ncbi:MAG: energy-coupling factor transporter transmembrane component T [Candidatus Gastranaerophilales bacterium]|nr:energy-coupling factor transporter transmembrane component T [Candidatus Gastranaerophilales bacterium]
MRIVDIDYYAIYGNSWLHKISATKKLTAVLLILTSVILVYDYRIIGILYLVLLTNILFSKLPKLKIIALSLYPLIFVSLLIFSTKNIGLPFIFLLIFKVITASTAFVTVIFTTSFIEIFQTTEKFLPSFLVSVLFLTYRSIFILWTTLENLQLAMYIRGRPQFRKPFYSIKVISNALGFLIITAIEASENMYEGMRLRGYSGNLKYLRK